MTGVATLMLKALAMWGILLVAMMANGILRVAVLQPHLGEHTARQLASVLGVLIIFGLSLPFVRRLESPTGGELLTVGLLWLALTVVFEFGMGYASGASWETMTADYDLRRGRLWPLVLLATLLAPWLWGAVGLAGRRG